MNGVDGVVLVVIQITDDPSAERTAPPCSTHVQPGDVSYTLISIVASLSSRQLLLLRLSLPLSDKVKQLLLEIVAEF